MKYKWELIIGISVLLLFLLYWCKDVKGKTIYTSDNEMSDEGTEREGTKTSPINILPKPKKKKSPKNKHEKECRRILQKIFNKSFHSVRPDFLEYKSGSNLELDMYNEQLNLACEYQGAQHAKYIPFFHKSYQDYVKLVERDNWKQQKCKELNIKLLRIPHTIKFENLEEYIKEELRKIGLA